MSRLSAMSLAVLCFMKDEAGGSRMEYVLLAAIFVALCGLAFLALRRTQFTTS
jgi:Flp pilus assembly pilin Flp